MLRGVRKPKKGETYKEWNTIKIQIPETLTVTRTYSKKGKVNAQVRPLIDLTKNLAIRKVNGTSLRSIKFKLMDIKKPEIIDRSDDWGETTIAIPEDMLYTAGKDGKLQRLKDAITNSKTLAKVNKKYSIILIPSPENVWKILNYGTDVETKARNIAEKKKPSTFKEKEIENAKKKEEEMKEKKDFKFFNDIEKELYAKIPKGSIMYYKVNYGLMGNINIIPETREKANLVMIFDTSKTKSIKNEYSGKIKEKEINALYTFLDNPTKIYQKKIIVGASSYLKNKDNAINYEITNKYSDEISKNYPKIEELKKNAEIYKKKEAERQKKKEIEEWNKRNPNKPKIFQPEEEEKKKLNDYATSRSIISTQEGYWNHQLDNWGNLSDTKKDILLTKIGELEILNNPLARKLKERWEDLKKQFGSLDENKLYDQIKDLLRKHTFEYQNSIINNSDVKTELNDGSNYDLLGIFRKIKVSPELRKFLDDKKEELLKKQNIGVIKGLHTPLSQNAHDRLRKDIDNLTGYYGDKKDWQKMNTKIKSRVCDDVANILHYHKENGLDIKDIKLPDHLYNYIKNQCKNEEFLNKIKKDVETKKVKPKVEPIDNNVIPDKVIKYFIDGLQFRKWNDKSFLDKLNKNKKITYDDLTTKELEQLNEIISFVAKTAGLEKEYNKINNIYYERINKKDNKPKKNSKKSKKSKSRLTNEEIKELKNMSKSELKKQIEKDKYEKEKIESEIFDGNFDEDEEEEKQEEVDFLYEKIEIMENILKSKYTEPKKEEQSFKMKDYPEMKDYLENLKKDPKPIIEGLKSDLLGTKKDKIAFLKGQRGNYNKNTDRDKKIKEFIDKELKKLGSK